MNSNNFAKELELYTSDSGHYYIDINSYFTSGAVGVLFLVKIFSKSEKVRAAEHLQHQC